VVCFGPDDGVRLIKRVVAIPGDTIAMRNNSLTINGQPLEYTIRDSAQFSREIYEDTAPILATEKGATGKHWVMSLPSRNAMRNFDELTVPEGKYFIMGDSRDNSRDSRFFGFVDREQIVGKSPGVALSFDKNRTYLPRGGRWFSKFGADVPE
jgi:signal peptidase I